MADTNIPADIKRRLENAYDAIAPKYNETFTTKDDPVRLGYLNRLLDLLKSPERKDAKVLELGCGAGLPGTKRLLENEAPKMHVIGNDLSSTQISLARNNLGDFGERLELRQGDMMDLSFPESSLDAVVGFYSVIHLPRAEQTELVERIAKWLKPGGLFLANFSKEESANVVNSTWLGEEKGWMYWSGWVRVLGVWAAEMVTDFIR
ncbi:S-adenosyl-L-methionine-dependent methyltransferase [Massarina eburnea CBS 473.64]|uniref:S-adenosyl-L-methionine-dependent methyltransferase n=1 Tax=Massarina eburnea CBS 473.64 TaxID=1395130 RepID=A0A6A6SA71_9PLEO|nr:S-adenosyl-L-methionine-dependent methyltransferase [Massarina eburnea CBS 473.64]